MYKTFTFFGVLFQNTSTSFIALGWSLFARRYSGNLFDFFSSGYLDVSVPRVNALRYCFTIPGCPIRTSTDQWLFAPPRSFSQLITSFIVSESLGIPRTPLVTSYYFFCRTLALFARYFFSYLSMNFANPIYIGLLVDNIGIEPI